MLQRENSSATCHSLKVYPSLQQTRLNMVNLGAIPVRSALKIGPGDTNAKNGPVRTDTFYGRKICGPRRSKDGAEAVTGCLFRHITERRHSNLIWFNSKKLHLDSWNPAPELFCNSLQRKPRNPPVLPNKNSKDTRKRTCCWFRTWGAFESENLAHHFKKAVFTVKLVPTARWGCRLIFLPDLPQSGNVFMTVPSNNCTVSRDEGRMVMLLRSS